MTTNDYNPTPPPWLSRQQEGAGQEQSPPADPFGQPDQGQQPYGTQPPGVFAPPAPAAQPWAEDGGGQPSGYPRQEIGTDGTVRRVAFDAPANPQAFTPPPPPAQQQQQPGPVPFDAPATGQQSYQQPPPGPVYTWAPPQQQQPAPQQHQAPAPPQVPAAQPNWADRAAQLQPTQRGGKNVNDLSLLKRAKKPPRSGWRLAIHRLSGGTLNPGESAADTIQRELVERVNSPVRGDYRIAILSLKGGVGKTTTTVGLGSTFASLRGDRVIAIDANPDLGTLAHRVPRQTPSTVRDLLGDGNITRYSDVRAHTSQAPSRLEVLASEQDPAVSEAFSEQDYRTAIGILQQFYNIILTDCGTGLMHSAMTGVLDMASSLVLVTSPAIDGARSASATLDWLEHHGYGKLVERTVVVVNASRRGASSVDIDQLRKLFLDRTRAVQVVPFDEHLAEGAEIDLELVNKVTKQALLELAAMVADDFPLTSGRPS